MPTACPLQATTDPRRLRRLGMTNGVVDGETAPVPLCYHRHEQFSTVVMSLAIIDRMQDFEEDDQIPVISGRGEGIMEEAPATGSGAARRNEDIALDLMKFVAMTTGYGRVTSSGVGFQGSGAAAKPEDYAEKLLELYSKCLSTVGGKK